MLPAIASKAGLLVKSFAAATTAAGAQATPAAAAFTTSAAAAMAAKGPTIFDKLGGRDNVKAAVDKVSWGQGSSPASTRRSPCLLGPGRRPAPHWVESAVHPSQLIPLSSGITTHPPTHPVL
jgi:hypothetical protein